MTLFDALPQEIEVGGVTYTLQLAFDRVLRYMHLVENPGEYDTVDIIECGYEWLVKSPRICDVRKKYEVLEAVFSHIISPASRKLKTAKKAARAFDFTIDAEYIYAAFMQFYKIDLIEQQGKLHWCRFLALFNGLPDGCVLKQIMGIRTQELPQPNAANAKQRQLLLELKTLYALPAAGGQAQSNAGWGSLFDLLKAKAEEVRKDG